VTSDVLVSGECDVVVCGAGPAGIGAAVAAAREDARTLLVERLSHVGGVATGALIQSYMDTPGGPIFDELVEHLVAADAAQWNYDARQHNEPGRVRFHSETLKPIALKMLREAGAEALFCTMAEGACMDGDRVRGVFVVNKGGRSIVKADAVVDCTADGDIAASAGAEFCQGDPDDGRLQHVNFKFDMDGIDWRVFQERGPSPEESMCLARQAQDEGRLHPPRGVFRPSAATFPFHEKESEWALAKWEIENVDPTDPAAVSNILVECQLAAFEVVEFCRRHLPGFERCKIRRFPDVLGARESRRIVGEYVLTKEDVLGARKFEDAVARASFFIDFHDSPPGRTIPYSFDFKWANRPPAGDWYEIPYRCLIPRGIQGLLVAGRCISADRDAQASLRVMPTCMFTGTAAGAAAARAVHQGKLPHEIEPPTDLAGRQ